MAKAYRSDEVGERRFQDAIGQLRDVLPSVLVNCPTPNCRCSYQVYDYILADVDGNRRMLQDQLQQEHPNHPNEMIIINEPRQEREGVNQAAARIVKQATEGS